MGRDKPISASAIRNQENGTNGIPLPAVATYAEILKVEPTWIVWGDNPGEGLDIPPNEEVDAIWDDLNIHSGGLVSAHWHPPMLNPRARPDDQMLWVGVVGWSAKDDELEAYEVMDDSLEPHFHRGTWLITAPKARAVIWDDAYVLACTFRGGHVVHAVRNVGFAPGVGAVLLMAPKDAAKDELDVVLTRDGEVSEDYWIDRVVIATYSVESARAAGARPLVIPDPDWMSSPTLLDESRITLDEQAEMAAKYLEESKKEDFEGVPFPKRKPGR